MVAHLITTEVFCINSFVRMNVASKKCSPLLIATGTILDYNINFRVMFSEFVHVCEGNRDEMTPRSVDDLALEPNGNLQGGIRCFSLDTGRILKRRDASVHKISVSAISRKNFMRKKQKAIKS